MLFDVGESAFLRPPPKAVFITHLHPDHAYFMRGARREIALDVPAYAPETTDRWSAVAAAPESVSAAGLEVLTIPTQHSKAVKSTG